MVAGNLAVRFSRSKKKTRLGSENMKITHFGDNEEIESRVCEINSR